MDGITLIIRNEYIKKRLNLGEAFPLFSEDFDPYFEYDYKYYIQELNEQFKLTSRHIPHVVDIDDI